MSYRDSSGRRATPSPEDSIAHVVSWNGRTELPANVVANGTKVRFYSRYCDLYSFKIA